MTREQLKEDFDHAVKAETILTDREKDALLGMYQELRVDIELQSALVEMDLRNLAGAITFLTRSGKILDDEEVWTLLSRLEAESYE